MCCRRSVRRSRPAMPPPWGLPCMRRWECTPTCSPWSAAPCRREGGRRGGRRAREWPERVPQEVGWRSRFFFPLSGGGPGVLLRVLRPWGRGVGAGGAADGNGGGGAVLWRGPCGGPAVRNKWGRGCTGWKQVGRGEDDTCEVRGAQRAAGWTDRRATEWQPKDDRGLGRTNASLTHSPPLPHTPLPSAASTAAARAVAAGVARPCRTTTIAPQIAPYRAIWLSFSRRDSSELMTITSMPMA